jgi:hypothetical protein
MKIVQKLAVLIAILFASAGACARGTVPVVNFEDNQITTGSGKTLAAEEVRKLITAAAGAKRWTVTAAGREKMQATLNVRSHAVVVDVAYTATSYSIRYVDSTNLNYEFDAAGGKIHPSYNNWVKQLKQAIDFSFQNN